MLCRSLGLVALSATLAYSADDLRIGLIWSASAGVPAPLVHELQDETSRIFNLPNLQLIWKNLNEHSIGDSYNRVVVIRLTGNCSTPAVHSRGRGNSLGLTHISDGNVLPFVQIDCTRIQEALNVGFNLLTPRQMGRAMAMVAVHELHHVLTASSVHDREGVTKASFSRQDLLLADLSLGVEAIHRLQQCLNLTTLETQASRDQRPHSEE